MVASLFFGAVFFLAQYLQNGPRQRRAERRAEAAAMDGDALLRRAGRRGARGSLRRAAVRIAGLTLQTAGMGWIALIADPGMDYVAMVPR